MDIVTLEQTIAAYQQQYADMQAGLQALDVNYQQQKAIGTKTVDMCLGAIAALEQLIEQEKTAHTPTDEPPQAG